MLVVIVAYLHGYLMQIGEGGGLYIGGLPIREQGGKQVRKGGSKGVRGNREGVRGK
jgi:hypothetical protein